MAFDLLWRFDAKKKNNKKTNKKKQKTKNKNKNKKTKKNKKKIVCLFDIRYSFRFERFIIPLRVK